MVHDARQHGLRAVVFNSRGTSDGPVTTPQFYSASYTGDMRAVVAAVLPLASIVRLAELCSCTLVRWLFLSCKSLFVSSHKHTLGIADSPQKPMPNI